MSIFNKNEPLNAEILYLSGQQPVRNQWRENYLKINDFMWPWKLENASPVPQMNQLNQWATQMSESFEYMSIKNKKI